MPILSHVILRKCGYAIFEAAGLPEDQARIVTDHLVDANLVGHDSHGIHRMPGYARGVRDGGIRPAGNHKVVRETPASLTIDAGGGIGIVVANLAMRMAVDRALQHTLGAVAVHRSGHIGRLGDFPSVAAERDCIGILMLNGGGRFAAPFGGTGQRLPPNPIAIGVPTGDGPPMTLDITTCIVAGGKVDICRLRGQPMPEDWMVDRDGNTVTDPEELYAGNAAMLPLGGAYGHKGYGLAMMIDAIAGGLSWAGCSAEAPTRGGSGFLALAIKIESFADVDDFKSEVRKLIDWVKTSPTMPGVERIYVPGEIEIKTRKKRVSEGVSLEEATWSEIRSVAEELGVAVSETGSVA